MAGQLLFRVRAIIRETQEAITIVLDPLAEKQLHYLPGQFLTFIFNLHGKEIRRSYSLSSTLGIDPFPTITLKRIPNGEISNYLFHHIKVGDTLTAIAPAGHFVYNGSIGKTTDLFLIAAGAGISPIYSILKAALAQENKSHITLIYSNSKEKNTIFFKEIEELARDHANRFRCIHILSNPDNKEHRYKAHLNIGLLEELVIQNTHFEKGKALFYLCGPFPYMRMARMTLIAMGYNDDQIRKENFVVKDVGNAFDKFPITDFSQRNITISYKGSKHSFQAPYDKNILKVGLDNGLSLPYSCLGGVCGTCAAKCIKGKVWMSINEVLTDKDQAQGLILTCTGYALTKDVVIEF